MKSESLTEIEHMASQIPVGHSNHFATRDSVRTGPFSYTVRGNMQVVILTTYRPPVFSIP